MLPSQKKLVETVALYSAFVNPVYPARKYLHN